MRTQDKRITVRMTSKQYNELQRRLTEAKMKQNDFVLSCISKHPITVVDVEGLAALQKQLGAVGNNLNQIARAVNSGQFQNLPVVADLQKGVGELWQLLRLVKVVKR